MAPMVIISSNFFINAILERLLKYMDVIRFVLCPLVNEQIIMFINGIYV